MSEEQERRVPVSLFQIQGLHQIASRLPRTSQRDRKAFVEFSNALSLCVQEAQKASPGSTVDIAKYVGQEDVDELVDEVRQCGSWMSLAEMDWFRIVITGSIEASGPPPAGSGDIDTDPLEIDLV